MAKKKPQADGAASEPAASAKQPMSYRPEADVRQALDDYRASFEFKPSYSDIIDRAVRRYLREKGFKSLAEEAPE